MSAVARWVGLRLIRLGRRLCRVPCDLHPVTACSVAVVRPAGWPRLVVVSADTADGGHHCLPFSQRQLGGLTAALTRAAQLVGEASQ